MDYFFQEQRWTDTFLSLHVKKFKRIILFLLIAFSAVGAKAQSDVKFNDGVRYSQWVIDSRMNDFYANTEKCGFAVYDQNDTKTVDRVDGKTKLDYVVGLVAKSIIEASQYYSQYDWAKSFAKPWFLSIQNYGDSFYNQFRSTSGSLDDLNAVKLFLPLRELTAPNATYANSTTYANAASALNTALSGLRTHNTQYSIGSETLAKTAGKTVAGGWWHKSDYQNQMWLDGSYMGPALFAQLVNYSGKKTNIDSSNDWDLIVKQFTILHEMCWNETAKLPYHAFAADGGTNSTSHSDTWAGLSSKSPYVFHSASYWGRAVGWYFLALVDILEQMEEANLSSSTGYTTLKGYLAETAAGIKARQDQTTGGWYQILDENNEFSASSYNNGKSHTTTYNYIESSATALFTAAYLKAIRLGYLAENDYKTVAVNGYKCLVNNFFSVDENGKVNIFGSCRSAGLGGSGDNYKAGKERYRDGSKEYYLLGYDVAKVEKTENKTEGKVLGAFIMAATEYERQYQPSTLLSKDLNSTYTLSSNESLSVEVLGDGTAKYKWYNANTSTAIEGATNASYIPTESGKYYCVITVTPSSTSGKTRAASGSYTITTRTADVTVSGTSTGDTGNTGGESSTTGTAVTEVVTFQNQTPTVTYSMTPADATKIEVTAAGIDNSNRYLLSEYTAFVKMNSNGSLSLNIPDGATNINVTLLSSKSVDNLKLNSDLRTSTTWTGNDTDGYTYSFDIANSLAGSTYTIKKGDGISYIHKITITYSLGSSTEPAPSTDASARFTYNGLALSFTENVATITLESSQANSSITVNAAPATGASITTSSASTSIADNVITITAPAAGSSASYIYTVKAADGTKTQVYTINVIVKPYTVTFDAGTNGTCTTQSITQTSAGASITLPEVTPNTGYTFAGWYTAATDGDIIGDAGATYNPTADITLYAHYTTTSSGGGETSFSGVVHFTGDGTTTSNEDVVRVESGTMKTKPGTITYKNVEYSNALKIGSSTSVTLTLTAKSSVVLVFNPSNKDNTIKVDGTVHTIGDDGTITVSELGSGTHTITRGNGESYFYAVDIQPAGASLTITTQPASADYLQNATAAPLSVTASIVNGTTSEYNFSYQWYSNGNESTTGSTPIGDATTEPSCTPTVTQIGTKYYYCVVTATKESEKLTATSDFAKVTVNGPTVTFTTQPQGAVYTRSDSENAAALTVAATTNFNGTVKYQWYSNTTGTIPNPVDDKEKIPNADSENYTPSINTVGKKYYYCIASSTYNTIDYTAVSDLVCVDVVYSYNVQGKTKPSCNESRYIEDRSGNKLVKFTFGGWKYNNNRYLKPNADDIDANYITDGWSDPATQAKVNALDGYEYAISGKNDAVQEDKTATKEMYGKTRYGWFESPTRDKNGVTTDSHPYTLPVRGAYMTFEPTQNGTLTIYLLQNGAWNSDTKNNIDIIPGEFRMHAFQITNQRGLVLAEFAPKYKITVNQKVMDGYTCSQCTKDPGVGKYDKTSKDISNWEEFWTLTQAERQAVYENWNNGINGSQTIIKLGDGSFLAIQKAIVKYEFHVTGNETYYVFSNFSKLGFSGATFQPDAQPQATVEGKISQLELSDVTAYNKITATETGKNIEGTDLKEYTYTIGETEIAPVAGVTIPQFYSITLKRTFKPNQWTTLSLPFNLTQTEVEQIFGKGTQIIVFDKAKITSARTYLTFFYHEIQNVLPGYPYLIRPTLVDANDNQMETKSNSADNTPTYTITKDGDKLTLTEFTVYNKAINPHITQHEFTSGDYTAKCTPSYCTANVSGNGKKDYSKHYEKGDIFVSENNGTVYISEGSSYGKGYRSYIDYTGTTAPAKALSISFSGVEDDDDNGTTTDICIAELADDVIETLGIGGVYNLNGQKVADTTRNLPAGIYIVNGRKVVVK